MGVDEEKVKTGAEGRRVRGKEVVKLGVLELRGTSMGVRVSVPKSA